MRDGEPGLILASASPRRKELLASLGVTFEIVPSTADELHDSSLAASELCEFNAARKAEAVAEQFPEAVVLGADTLVALGGELFGKPKSPTEAVGMLEKLQGRTHQVITGICLLKKRW